MTPMPINPAVVLLVDRNTGAVMNERNNIGNDLKLVTTHTQADFNEAASGVPYLGGTESMYDAHRQTLAMKRNK